MGRRRREVFISPEEEQAEREDARKAWHEHRAEAAKKALASEEPAAVPEAAPAPAPTRKAAPKKGASKKTRSPSESARAAAPATSGASSAIDELLYPREWIRKEGQPGPDWSGPIGPGLPPASPELWYGPEIPEDIAMAKKGHRAAQQAEAEIAGYAPLRPTEAGPSPEEEKTRWRGEREEEGIFSARIAAIDVGQKEKLDYGIRVGASIVGGMGDPLYEQAAEKGRPLQAWELKEPDVGGEARLTTLKHNKEYREMAWRNGWLDHYAWMSIGVGPPPEIVPWPTDVEAPPPEMSLMDTLKHWFP